MYDDGRENLIITLCPDVFSTASSTAADLGNSVWGVTLKVDNMYRVYQKKFPLKSIYNCTKIGTYPLCSMGKIIYIIRPGANLGNTVLGVYVES